jgi:hypothetical protein
MIYTVIGESTTTDTRKNAFGYVPVVAGIGAVVGIVMGGTLVFPDKSLGNTKPPLSEFLVEYP